VVPRFGRTNLVDRLEMARQVLAVAEFEERRMAVGRHAHVTTRIVQAVDLHVPRVAYVPDVDRIEQDDCGEVAAGKCRANAALAIGAKRDGVGRRGGIERGAEQL
jgi:hypothetical protein